jgi:hypothetical protein
MFDIEYPKRPDISLKLYESDGHWKKSGYIYQKGNLLTIDAWDAYADGYLEVVEKLLNNVDNDDFLHDTFGYPIFFLFYHYLEIRMKEIIKNGRDLIDNPLKTPQGHDLVYLWGECKKILKELDGWNDYSQMDEESRQNYLVMDHFIKEIAIDPYAQSFRYPVDKKGKILLGDQRIKSLNVHNLAIVVRWMSLCFEGFSTGIDEYRKTKNEIAAENYNEEFL